MEGMPEGWNKHLPSHHAIWQFMVCPFGAGKEGKKISPNEFTLAPQHSETHDRVCLSPE